jgi:hypothetical protein
VHRGGSGRLIRGAPRLRGFGGGDVAQGGEAAIRRGLGEKIIAQHVHAAYWIFGRRPELRFLISRSESA